MFRTIVAGGIGASIVINYNKFKLDIIEKSNIEKIPDDYFTKYRPSAQVSDLCRELISGTPNFDELSSKIDVELFCKSDNKYTRTVGKKIQEFQKQSVSYLTLGKCRELLEYLKIIEK